MLHAKNVDASGSRIIVNTNNPKYLHSKHSRHQLLSALCQKFLQRSRIYS